MARGVLVALAMMGLLGSSTLAGGQAPVRDRDIVAEDYFDIAVVTGSAVSPDGAYVAYTEMRWQPPDKRRNLDLWVVDTGSGQATRLTFDKAADSNPQWSPDNRWIYFTSSRRQGDGEDPPYNGKTQVWRIRPDGGPVFPVTRATKSIQHYELSHDGRTLYYAIPEEQVDDEWKDLHAKYKDLELGQGVVEFSQVWTLDLESWRTEKLIDDKRVIRDLAVAPAGGRIAMITTPTDELISHEGRSRVDIHDVATGEIITLPDRQWREDAPSPYGWLESPAWSPDGKALAFSVDFDGYPAEIFVAHLGGGEPRIQKLVRPGEVSVSSGGGLHWRSGQDLCFVAEDHARARVYCITGIRDGRQGKLEVLTPGDVAVDRFSLSRSGDRLAAVLSTTTHPPDVFLLPGRSRAADNPYTRLTKVNPQVDTWRIPQIKLVTWKGWNGDDVEGILELPPDYREGDGPLPMIVELHGGPTAASLYRFRLWIYGRVVMAARGYALLSPNYRGSTGYGDRFLTELVGHKNDRDVVDIMTGVDAMIDAGIADPDRLGVMGWSNGGYLTNCVIAHTDRFKAASSGAGILDAALQWAAEDTPGHVVNFQKGLPWERAEQMRSASPLYDAGKIRTPTLIHVGGSDQRCPPAHSKGLFRALHEYLHVPSQLVVYPGEGHGLRVYENRKAKMDWDKYWFDKYLPLDAPASDPALGPT